MSKLKSRKFWMAVVSAIVLILTDGLGLEIDSHTVIAFAAMVISFILGESYIDGKREESLR